MTRGVRYARWAWIVAVCAAVGLVVRRFADIWSEASSVGPAPEYFNASGQYSLSPSQAEALTDIGLSPDWHAAFVTIRLGLIALTVVALSTLLWRRSRTWAPLFLAWFLLVGMLLTAITDDGTDGDLPPILGIPVLVLFAGGIISFVGLLLVFPDDSSARWVLAPLTGLVLIPVYAAVTDNDTIGDWGWENGPYVAFGALLLGLVLQTVRIYKSRDRTARDLLVLSAATLGVMVTLGFGSDPWSGVDGSRQGLGTLLQRLTFETLFMAVPVTFGLAVLWILVRRGHWDMDVKMRGSVGYAGLTTFLVLGYFGVVAVVQAVVNDVSGIEGNTFALVVSTAVIAAIFLPARTGLQRVVDSVFDRRRRHSEKRVLSFETAVRRGAAPQDVAGALVEVVDDVFRPESAALWVVRGSDR